MKENQYFVHTLLLDGAAHRHLQMPKYIWQPLLVFHFFHPSKRNTPSKIDWKCPACFQSLGTAKHPVSRLSGTHRLPLKITVQF